MNLLLITHDELDSNARVTLTGERATHLREVIRAGVGDTVRVGIVDGPMGAAQVISVDKAGAVLDARSVLGAPTPPRPRIDVLLAMPRPKVMKRLFTQLACLGVGHIFLTMANRVERAYLDAHVTREEEYRALLLDGLSQARDTRLPTVSIHPSLTWLIEKQMDRAEVHARRMIADLPLFTAQTQSIRDACAGVLQEERVLVAMGPEGGWQDDERVLFAKHGYVTVDLGPRALRTDLATIAAITLARDALK